METKILMGKLRLLQPERGYRVGADALLLASLVENGESLLDVGCGVGSVALTILLRSPNMHATGIEVQPLLADLAQKNAENMSLPLKVINQCFSEYQEHENFDWVVANPPFYQDGRPSPNAIRCHAHHEHELGLRDWLSFMAKRLKPKGCLGLILPPDRLQDALTHLPRHLGGIVITPVYNNDDLPAKRVLLTARNSSKKPVNINPALDWHGDKMQEILAGDTL